jgi:hypothetical protein
VETHQYRLSRGRHFTPDRGRCAMEWVAELTGEAHTDRPRTTSAVAAEYVRRFNDVLADGPRQRLRPYLSRMIGTAGDGLDEHRALLCVRRLVDECLPVALEAAGLDVRAGRLEEARSAAAAARSAARERARRGCVESEWWLRRERVRAAARAAGRASALDATRAALSAAAPDAPRLALAETAWAATWDALWAAAWDGRPMPAADTLLMGAFELLDAMLPGEVLDPYDGVAEELSALSR